MRDPNGIRPAFYYVDDEVVVAASERPVIQTAFDLNDKDVKELEPGHALIIKKDGSIQNKRFIENKPNKACSFERIYFSRGTDKDIYQERKELGKLLTPNILKEIDYNLRDTVFSYIPNTASVAFQGMMDQIHTFSAKMIKDKILKNKNNLSEEMLDIFLSVKTSRRIYCGKRCETKDIYYTR